MAILNPKIIKAHAAHRLSAAAPDPRRIILLHSGVVVLINLLSSGISIYLDSQIGTTGGLSGLGTRSILHTMHTFLRYTTLFFTPFWSAGIVFAALGRASGTQVGPKSLLTGFRRISSILSHQLLLMLLYFLIGFGCANVASILFTMTPLSADLISLLESMQAEGTLTMAAIEALPADTLIRAFLPMLVIYLAILIPSLIYLLYNLRLTIFLIMSGSQMSAMRAMLTSAAAMRGHKLQMVKLDLSFWWYYLAQAALMVILYADVLLQMMGFDLPFDPIFSFFATLIVYCVLELALHLWKKAEVETAYALAFQRIVAPEEQEAQSE